MAVGVLLGEICSENQKWRSMAEQITAFSRKSD